MPAVITCAQPTDAPALAACIDAAYRVYRYQGLTLPPVSDGIDTAIATCHVWVVRCADHIIGGVIMSLDGPEAYLENIAVHPDHAGQGLARQLIDRALTTARTKGCTVIKLTTHAAMPANVALYEHLGWHVTRSEGDKVAMAMHLAPPA